MCIIVQSIKMLIFQWTILKLSIIYFDSLESLLSLWGASCEHQRFLCSLVTLSYKPRCDDFDHFHQARTIISWGKKQDALGVQRERKLPVEKEKRHSHHLPLQEMDDCSERRRQKQRSSPIYEWAWKPSIHHKKTCASISTLCPLASCRQRCNVQSKSKGKAHPPQEEKES